MADEDSNVDEVVSVGLLVVEVDGVVIDDQPFELHDSLTAVVVALVVAE